MPVKQRLDQLLVDLGLESSRSRAQARILAGDVVVNDHRIDKPGTLVASDADVRLKNNSLPYVSRGGLKLAAALERWPYHVVDAVCLDVGASTGGFTDVLLQAGAACVYAVDVGYGQLDWRLRQDHRVINMERTHILKVLPDTFKPKPWLAVIDVSFISLKKVLPGILPHLARPARVYALVKPQFEVGPEYVSKGGIVKDEAARKAALIQVIEFAKELGFTLIGSTLSPITGADGNIEFLLALHLD